jgi:hypothetical protein
MFAHVAIDTVGSVRIRYIRSYYIAISKLVPVILKIQLCIIDLRLKIGSNSLSGSCRLCQRPPAAMS